MELGLVEQERIKRVGVLLGQHQWLTDKNKSKTMEELNPDPNLILNIHVESPREMDPYYFHCLTSFL